MFFFSHIHQLWALQNAYVHFGYSYPQNGLVYVKTIPFRANMYRDNLVQNYITILYCYMIFSFDALLFRRKEKYRCDCKNVCYFCCFCPEIVSRCVWILILTISLNFLGKSCMEKCINLYLCVGCFKNYVIFWILFVRVFVRDICKQRPL